MEGADCGHFPKLAKRHLWTATCLSRICSSWVGEAALMASTRWLGQAKNLRYFLSSWSLCLIAIYQCLRSASCWMCVFKFLPRFSFLSTDCKVSFSSNNHHRVSSIKMRCVHWCSGGFYSSLKCLPDSTASQLVKPVPLLHHRRFPSGPPS